MTGKNTKMIDAVFLTFSFNILPYSSFSQPLTSLFRDILLEKRMVNTQECNMVVLFITLTGGRE